MTKTKDTTVNAITPPQNHCATALVPNPASESLSHGSRAPKEHDSLTVGHEPTTKSGTSVSALSIATRLLNSHRANIQLLGELAAERVLTVGEQDLLRSCCDAEKKLEAQIRKSKADQNGPSVPPTATKQGQRKRKRRGHGWAPKKRNPGHPDNYNFDPDREYKIRGIMNENDKKYKIKWARTDGAGGDFLDSWVPKEYANKHAKKDWASRKKQGREKLFNDAEGEYDTSGGEEEEEERVEQKKTKKIIKDSGVTAKGKR